MTSTSKRQQVLSLYRNILRAHAQVLSGDQRALGDRYVKDEFRRHKDIKNEVMANEFVSEWDKYLGYLIQVDEQQARQREQELVSQDPSKTLGTALGRDLKAEEMGRLTEEQMRQLMRLELEARKKR